MEFRQKIIELARAGRSAEELAKEFEPHVQTIQSWIVQADRDSGLRQDGLTGAERDELIRLRRENRQLKVEREILSKAAAWFARDSSLLGRPGRSPRRVPLRESESGGISGGHYVSTAARPRQRLLCVVGAGPGRHVADLTRPCCSELRPSTNVRAAPMARHASTVKVAMPCRTGGSVCSCGQKARGAVNHREGDNVLQAGLRGVSRRKWITTTVRAPHVRPAPDLVQRHFYADAPDRLWVADITYVPTWVGFVFLAVVLDAYSRNIVTFTVR